MAWNSAFFLNDEDNRLYISFVHRRNRCSKVAYVGYTLEHHCPSLFWHKILQCTRRTVQGVWVQFLQAHCAALDQLRSWDDQREGVCNIAKKNLGCERIKNIPTYSSVCPPLLCEAVSAVLSSMSAAVGACQAMTLIVLGVKLNTWNGG